MLHTQSTRPATYCPAYTEYRASRVLYLHTQSTRPIMYCNAYTEYKAGHQLCCIHRVQGQQCIVLHTLSTGPVEYCTCIHRVQVMYCAAYRDWGRQCRPLHSVQPCYRRLALLRIALHHLGANCPSRSLAATCTLPSCS